MPTVERDGVSLYYEVQGDPLREPVMLLMGLGMDSQGWERQVPALVADHGVVLVDNRGIGRSDKPAGPYTAAMLAEDALAVLDALSLPQAHVAGVSMGGVIAQELALAHPERVASLVLAGTYARPGPELRALAARLGDAVSSVAAGSGGALDQYGPDARRLYQFIIPAVFTPAFLLAQHAYLEDLSRRCLAYRFPFSAFFAQLAAAMEHDAAARLPTLRTPTLVLTGADDRVVPPSHSDELAHLIDGSRLVKIEDSSHGANLEKADAFNATVLAFLAENPIAGGSGRG